MSGESYINKSDDPEAVRIRRDGGEPFQERDGRREGSRIYSRTSRGPVTPTLLAFANALPNIGGPASRSGWRLTCARARTRSPAMHLLHRQDAGLRQREQEASLAQPGEYSRRRSRSSGDSGPTRRSISSRPTRCSPSTTRSSACRQRSSRTAPTSGYIWKPTTIHSAPADLVPLGKAGDHGPLAGHTGRSILKDGLAIYQSPPVQDSLVDQSLGADDARRLATSLPPSTISSATSLSRSPTASFSGR